MQRTQQAQTQGDLPLGMSATARRALAQAGYSRLDQLAGVSEAEIKRLHGMGAKALGIVRQALSVRGLSFADEKGE
jgi:DNA-directed RNA polymerase alpha subunit